MGKHSVLSKLTSTLSKQYDDVIKAVGPKLMHKPGQNVVYTQSGIQIPKDYVSSTLIVDRFEQLLLEAVVVVFTNLSKDPDNIFSVFALRTLMDLSYRIRIIFDIEPSRQLQNRQFRVYLMLTDYAVIDRPQYINTYKTLLVKEKKILGSKRTQLFENLKMALEQHDPKVLSDSLIKVRKNINGWQKELLSKLDPITLPSNLNVDLEYLDSTFSHILHGDALLLKGFLDGPRAQERRIHHVNAVLLICGYMLVNSVEKYLNSRKITTVKDLNQFNLDLMSAFKENAKFFNIAPVH